MEPIASWICEYTEQRTCATRKALTDDRLLRQFAGDFSNLWNAQTSELFDRTDFLIEWAKVRNWCGRNRHAVSDELIAVRAFAEWLFESGRTTDNVYLYVRPKFEAVLKGNIPKLWLRHNLQPDIARFRRTLVNLPHKSDRVTLLQAAHWRFH